VRIPIWGSPFSLFFYPERLGARGGLENGRVFICEVVGGWMTCGVGEGAIGMPMLGLGREDDMWGHEGFGLGLVCGWERGDVDDSWAARKMTKQSC
jgi:hypothetical protein